MRIRIRALGAAKEVGRSAILIEDDKRAILLDCGVKIVHTPEGESKHITPEGLEEVAPKLDAVILSHAHLDHTGYAPALYRMGYKGKLYATPPTKDVVRILREDMLKIDKGKLRTRAEMDIAMNMFEVYPYEEEFEVADGVKVKFYDAGHSLGSAQILIDREGVRILYTGDIKPEPTEYFDGAKRPREKIDIVITESTNGAEEIPEREEVKRELLDAIDDTFSRGGNVLIPAFAYGRSQEVVATLVEKGVKNNIYMDGMSVKINDVFRRYRSAPRISERTLMRFRRPPFDMSGVIDVRKVSQGVSGELVRRYIIARAKNNIIVSTSGMLEGGPILSYLQLASADTRSLLAFSGYQVPGTVGRMVLDGYRTIPLKKPDGNVINVNLNMRVGYYRLSGHAGRKYLIEYIRSLSPSRILYVHGEEESIESLKEELDGEALELNKTIVVERSLA